MNYRCLNRLSKRAAFPESLVANPAKSYALPKASGPA